jgi:DpnII restriction endonuclease
MQPEADHSVVPAPQEPPLDKPSINLSHTRLVESALDSSLDQDPLHLIRKVCHRFHAVARQLRLRRDYRATLEVEDDHDLQDLLCALLKLEFDEVTTDEWTPPYTEGAPRTTLLVNRDQIAVVAKKTRAGLTTKELADQVAADTAYYRDQGRCSILFCFMYDPEGRIGSPKRLETTLTSVSEYCRVEVLVAPK